MKTYEELNRKKSCLSCKHFRGVEDIYEDNLETWELGWCYHPDTPPCEMAGDELTCDEFENNYNDD